MYSALSEKIKYYFLNKKRTLKSMYSVQEKSDRPKLNWRTLRIRTDN